MTKDLSTEIVRFKTIRLEQQMTQQAFAESLGIKGSTADIERGKTRIPGEVVALLLDRFHINPLWLFGKSEQKYLQAPGHGVLPKVVTLNSAQQENIVLVPVKASAGYAHNLQDPQWYDALPAFDLPLPEFRNATYRGFQVEGNSMFPVLHNKEWVIAKAEEKLSDIKEDKMYVVVLSDTVVVKKVFISGDTVRLISINTEYPVIEIKTDEVQELWQVTGKITHHLEVPSLPMETWAKEITSELKEIKASLNK
ncbi:XRE family transcriptional regulator [Sinomicrobium weinanense]|uniref:Helix-turn-helix domain-containing protein n=1 Tax=Sinomicrobium weinanense TaxID=2842200 RepID=A0A926JWD9_9FLAO|nr:LexA family transcriptional regulator [Sinomicrobium weinanense]MBC9798417.1 helix-turn-helix domain-containing protein [Sinomicrobium weinanense]MBU3125997.1 LexA family transcriptional regulator [Sinomicrobium weinanense]